MRFSDRVFAITGAGSGIGESAAKKLAADGAHVVVADFDAANGERVVAEIADAGGTAAFVKVNVAEEADAVALVDFVVSTFGRLDGAINNAGVGQPVQRIHEMDTAAWDRIHSVDLRGVFLCMRAQLKQFLDSGGGTIVNTASGAGLKAAPGQGSYVAAKHGVIGLTKQAAIEYVTDNIRVNAVAPGLVATPQFRSYPKEDQEMYSAMQPGGRPAEPEEIANAMAWLLSDEASFVSGETLLIDAAQAQK
ncbi:SDR family NAD(P)-dependent oxidoreductase [Paramicrobacterium chengjingii]|uniref:SDR family NAD(P)-dependent oxidoreductase n=1 Tax=Paramicrobacterium chengjingii TaxID=2769067 RepID=UPI0014240D91|nr:glucose 1-dehydrogenase [Microbacterium chengjingii]